MTKVILPGLAGRLKPLRNEKKMTQKEMAALLDCTDCLLYTSDFPQEIRPVGAAGLTGEDNEWNEGFCMTYKEEFIKMCIRDSAYPDRLGKVALKLRLKEGGILEILVRDWGVGIADVEQARTPLFTTGSEERSGMGFTIMESFMDVVKVRSTPGKGTQVTMRKRISPRMGGR